MATKNTPTTSQMIRRGAWGAIICAAIIVPAFAILAPSGATDQDTAASAQSGPELQYDLADIDEAIAASAVDVDAVELASADNRIADASPDGDVARPESPATASIDGYEIKRIFEIEGEFQHGDWVWDEEGAPKDGKLLVSVNLDAQTLSVYRGGYEIGTAVILYGADEKPTPTGKFTITQKNKDHISNLYFVPMPYMMRLTNDGIAIHGSSVEYGYATHGCVGVPDEFAAKLFAIAQLGTEVIIKAS
jgi:lipoprotein-anchoring transpeptidase ErfK/SrfK